MKRDDASVPVTRFGPESAGTAELGAVAVRPSNSQSREDKEGDHTRAIPCRHGRGAAVGTGTLEQRLEVLKTTGILSVSWVPLVSAVPKVGSGRPSLACPRQRHAKLCGGTRGPGTGTPASAEGMDGERRQADPGESRELGLSRVALVL